MAIDYSADLGTWESGETVPFTEDDDATAITVAHQIGRKRGLDVVQVRRGRGPTKGPIIFDQYNGRISVPR